MAAAAPPRFASTTRLAIADLQIPTSRELIACLAPTSLFLGSLRNGRLGDQRRLWVSPPLLSHFLHRDPHELRADGVRRQERTRQDRQQQVLRRFAQRSASVPCFLSLRKRRRQRQTPRSRSDASAFRPVDGSVASSSSAPSCSHLPPPRATRSAALAHSSARRSDSAFHWPSSRVCERVRSRRKTRAASPSPPPAAMPSCGVNSASYWLK